MGTHTGYMQKTSTPHSPYLTLAVFLIIIGLSGLSIYLLQNTFNKQDQGYEPVTVTTQTPLPTPTADWVKFTSTAFHYSLSHPNTSYVASVGLASDEPGIQPALEVSTGDGAASKVQIWIQADDYSDTKTYSADEISTLKLSLSDFAQKTSTINSTTPATSAVTQTTLNGVTAYTFTTKNGYGTALGQGSSMEGTWVNYILEKGTVKYTISYLQSDTTAATMVRTFTLN